VEANQGGQPAFGEEHYALPRNAPAGRRQRRRPPAPQPSPISQPGRISGLGRSLYNSLSRYAPTVARRQGASQDQPAARFTVAL
jgi:hypothetical protein